MAARGVTKIGRRNGKIVDKTCCEYYSLFTLPSTRIATRVARSPTNNFVLINKHNDEITICFFCCATCFYRGIVLEALLNEKKSGNIKGIFGRLVRFIHHNTLDNACCLMLLFYILSILVVRPI